ncbi:uncharacterized protein LOC131995857 [Stomoxys calcitrans]|nr:uncharacterized protein LOC131995857 [Stomoxys calcitrans]
MSGRRRRANIGRSTVNARRARSARDEESSTEREARLSQLRERNRTARERESSMEREARRSQDRVRRRVQRARESSVDHEARLSQNRNRIQRTRESAQTHSNAEQNGQPISHRWVNKEYSAMNYDPLICYKDDRIVSIGTMSVVCEYCLALKFKDESKGLCCLQGKVKLEEILPPPEPLHSLLTGDHPKSKQFIRNIRRYNNAFQMTSFKSKQVVERGFMPTFKIQGQVYHLAGSLLPLRPDDHKFLQIYFIADPDTQASTRCSIVAQPIDIDLIRSLQDMLHSHNSYIQSFKTAIESVPVDTPDYNVVIHANKVPVGEHRGRYNAPSTSEVAVVIAGQQFDKRDIVLRSRDDNLQKISELHRSYDSLQYPLMLCRGEDGYTINVPQVDPTSSAPLRKTVSCMNYYCYRIMTRQNNFNSLLRYGMLTNQYFVDQYAKIESERLAYIRNNQTKLRAENYVHLQDALQANEHSNNIGQLVILPSSFTGGPRYLHEKSQDAMTYVRHYGKPDLFITATCNPNWPEIKENINTNLTPQDRYDIVNRVFHLKVQKLLHLINKSHIFGPPRCHMYTIEWQKRGLPHVHLLVWLVNKIRPNQIDSVISAELPVKEDDPVLFEIVKKHMVHGPCGTLNRNSACMRDSKCSKKFPKPFQIQTSTSDDGYPKYRRRSPDQGGQSATVGNYDIDNRWIVPHNPLLLKIFDAHINVELCSSIKSIQYVTKYINKGSDQATFSIQSPNEVETYQSGRYICSSEAVWRMLSFEVHDRAPTIVHLAVHLENGQRVYFTENNIQEVVYNPRDTTLTAFFKLCAQDDFAKTLTYDRVPTYYTWNQSSKTFQRRKQGTAVDGFPGIKKTDALGRVYAIHPNNSECFHLRMLLHVVKGPTSFAHLRTVQGVIYNTYQMACKAMGLLEDDSHWENTLSEAAICSSATSLRYLFAIIVAFCQVTDSVSLWNKFRENMASDILIRQRRELVSDDLQYDQNIFDEALFELNKVVQLLTSKSINDFGLPMPANINSDLTNNAEYTRETSYDQSKLLQNIAQDEPRLNIDQKKVFTTLLSSIDNNEGKIFFLDAPGGTGKTFLINLLLTKVRSTGKIALAVASSGIAATLLEGGRTAHSTFKLPLKIATDDNKSICSISKQSNTGKLIRDCSLIVWDEATMSNKTSVEALDRTMRDLRSKNAPMGGCTILFSGDFRQILPVVPRGTRADEINASLKRSNLWPYVNKLELKTNMRLSLSSRENRLFSEMLLKVGNGKLTQSDGRINLDNLCVLIDNIQDLVNNVYPDIHNISCKTLSWFKERAILSPTNEQVDKANNLILAKIDTQTQIYYSVDTVLDSEEAVHFPTEFLNSLNPSGLPPHKMELKVGCPVILLRNLNPPKLCNGTRLLVKSLKKFIIECTILTGCGTGEDVLIPRIPLIPSDLPFQFKRLQFPVKISFAMTINKSQGQTFNVAGLDLSVECFSHGQLYVALSRVTSKQNMFVLANDKKAVNVVYKDIL